MKVVLQGPLHMEKVTIFVYIYSGQCCPVYTCVCVHMCCVHTSEIVVGIKFEFISFIDLLFTTKENFGSMCSTHEYSCVHNTVCTYVYTCVHMCTHEYS